MDTVQEYLDRISYDVLLPVSKDKIYELYEKYKITQEYNTLKQLINLINNHMNHPNIREFLDLKIENETIFDIMVKLKIDFSYLAMEYICSQEDLLVKVIKNGGYRILNSGSEEDFFRTIDGMSIFEYLISNDMFEDYWLIKFNQKHNIVEILKKYHKDEYLRNASETLLFEKYDEDKLVIEYLFEQDLFTPHDMDRIKNHPEIIDYIEKYNKRYLLSYLRDDILLSKKDDKLVLEHLLEKKIAPTLSIVTDDEIVNLLIKYKAYYPLSEITIKHAFVEVPDSNMQLFEFLLYRGIVSYNVISEIYRNTKYAPAIYEILKKHHSLNLLSNYDEDRMLLKYGQDKSLLESLLRDNQIIQIPEYQHKESLDLLLKYNRYDELSKCSKELLLQDLPSGKKLYEELIDRGIVIQTEEIESKEIANKIINEKLLDYISCFSQNLLLSNASLNETYLDKILDIIEEKKDYEKIYHLSLDEASITAGAKLYITFIRHGMYDWLKQLDVNALLKEENNISLLEELLNQDKKLTLNFVLTPDMKANVEIAIILKLHGIKQKNIKYDIVTRNMANEYTDKDLEELSNMPLIPEQERLLQELFVVMNDGKSEPSRLNALIATYRYLLSTNNQYSNEIYHLINLKKQNPDFRIEKTKETSHYCHGDLAIRLENLNTGTINHEVGHALHFMIDNASMPDGFKELIQKHKKSIRTHAMVTLFSKRYGDTKRKVSKYVDRVMMKEYDGSITEEDKIKIQEYLDSLKLKQREQYEQKGYAKQLLDMIFDRTFTVNDYLKQTRQIQRNEMIDRILRTEYPHFIVIGDFFDGIYEGKFRDGKLTDVLGLTHLRSSYGHGVEYYKDDMHAVFKEMIANYSQIMKSKNPKEGLEMLRFYLGDELVHIVSNHYIQNIYHNYSYINTQNQTL